MIPNNSTKNYQKWMTVSSLLLASLVAGCANSSNVPSEAAKTNPASSPAPAAAEGTEVSFLSYSNYEKPLKKVIEAFEKQNPNIKVKLELNPFAQLMESIEIKMGSKSKDMDMLFVDSPLVMNYAVKGYLEPLDKLLAADAKQKWAQSAVDAVSYQNQLMAAPMNSSSQVLYYNKSLFEQKGIAVPAEDKRMTWEEVLELAKKLTSDTNGDGQNDVFGFSFDQIGRPYQLLALSDSLGAKMVSSDGLVSTGYTNSPEAVKAFQFYADLFNKDKVSPKIKREESIDYFISGKVAMFVGANHNLPKLKASGLNFGVTLHPYFAGQKVATPTGAWNVGISKFSTKKEAAAKFTQFLTIGEGAKIMFEEGGTLPPQVELLDVIAKDAKYGEFPNNVIRMAARESRETAVPRPKTPGYLEWESNMNKAFEDMKNGTDPKKALDDAVTIIDNQLKKYKDAVK